MTEWKTYKIGDICKRVCSGGTPKSTEPTYYDGDIPWLNTKEINFNRIHSTERCITQKGLDNSSAKWVDANCVIVAMYGATAAKVAINKIPLTTNQACCNLSIDEKIADYYYVYYWLCANYTELASLANGGAQQNLNAQQIKDFEISLPSLDKQRRIAKILGTIDDKIELNRRINDNLEQQAQVLYKQLFVDNRNEDWETKKLENIIDIGSGKGLPRIDFAEGGLYPILGANGQIGRTNKFLIDKKDNILFTGRVGTLGNVFRLQQKRAWLSDNTLIITPKKEYYNYVYFFLKNSNLKEFNVGSTQPLVRQSDIKEMDIFIPDLLTLEAFEGKCIAMFNKINQVNAEIDILATLRDTLLPKLMNGEIITK